MSPRHTAKRGSLSHGGDEPRVGDAFLVDDCVQQLVLLGEELAAYVLGQARVAQRAEKVPRLAEGSGNGAGRELVAGVPALFLQLGDEEAKVFFDGGHGGLLIVVCRNPIISCVEGPIRPLHAAQKRLSGHSFHEKC